MISHREEDIRVPSHPGRVRIMKTFFGCDEPTEGRLLAATFSQIVGANAGLITFSTFGNIRIFMSDADWIGDKGILERLLSGAVMACPSLGGNSVRIETAYRYCYEKTCYGDINEVTLSLNQKGIPPLVTRGERYGLILENFGKYNWNEAPQ